MWIKQDGDFSLINLDHVVYIDIQKDPVNPSEIAEMINKLGEFSARQLEAIDTHMIGIESVDRKQEAEELKQRIQVVSDALCGRLRLIGPYYQLKFYFTYNNQTLKSMNYGFIDEQQANEVVDSIFANFNLCVDIQHHHRITIPKCKVLEKSRMLYDEAISEMANLMEKLK